MKRLLSLFLVVAVATANAQVTRFLTTPDTLNLIATKFKSKADSLYFAALIASKQNTLISGTNIKTVNGSSLLGSGNISISGSSSTDTTSLSYRINQKEPTITPGTTAQYWRGDKTWQTLPVIPANVSSFTNDAGYLANITGKVSAGSNVTVTGNGTSGSPYVINSTGGGSNGPVSTTASGSLLYDNDYRFMNFGTMASNVFFTPVSTGRVNGGGVYVRWVSDSVHVPTFDSALNIISGSVVRTTGMVNRLISMWNGYEYETTLTQLGIYSNAPPVQSSAAVANGTPSVVDITFNKSLGSGYVPLYSDFSISSGHTTTGTVTLTGAIAHVPVTPAFVNGESSKSITYVPGTSGNRLQDNSGNTVVGFTQSIANNVLPVDTTAPTLVSAIVSNSTPTHIDLTWSEAMNSTVSAASAFAVSAGHPLTGHTRVDATHSYLTTSTAFVNAEPARTLSYTQPSSNRMQDLATVPNLLANIPAASITNNVSPTVTSGALTFTNRSSSLTNTGTTFYGTGSYTFNAQGYDNLILPASGDGLIYFTVNTSEDVIMGFDATAAVQTYGAFDRGFYSSGGLLLSLTAGVIGSTVNPSNHTVNGDLVGIRRTAGVFTLEIYHSGVWTVYHTFTGTDNGLKYVVITVDSHVSDPQHIGLQ